MHNLWEFLLQTLTVSLAAGLLLLVKWLFADKLSPRWQYGIWGLLALRILLPARIGRDILLPLPLWLETAKAMAEASFSSAYAAVYAPIAITLPFPWVTGAPQSLTDWLFLFYAAGVAVTLVWYLTAYLRLRFLLRRGTPGGEVFTGRIQNLCKTYGLKACPTLLVSGLSSAFVCGVFRPVLVLPAHSETDDKVLLHELLHLKYHDGLQSVFWCILRALHWCNPFLQYVFHRIGGDMESLCDQRVLERLEGEARREYGVILLSMANERYASTPGTSSLSNGGKNIARRIAAIVRFKKYPRGMALVSVCIAICLSGPILVGGAAPSGIERYQPNSSWEFARAMALARTQRCGTMAGALDTYAKGLIYENGIYIATASPLSTHEALAEEMQWNAAEASWVPYHLDGWPALRDFDRSQGYSVYNLKELPEGGYEAVLVFPLFSVQAETNVILNDNALLPVTLRYEDAWVVEEAASLRVLPGVLLDRHFYPGDDFPYLLQYEAIGTSGTVSLLVDTCYTIDTNPPGSNTSFFMSGGTIVSDAILPNAAFNNCYSSVTATYTFTGNEETKSSLTSVGMQLLEGNFSTTPSEFFPDTLYGDSSGSSSDGSGWTNRMIYEDTAWDGTLTHSGGSSWPGGLFTEMQPTDYAVRIYWNGEAREDLILKEVD